MSTSSRISSLLAAVLLGFLVQSASAQTPEVIQSLARPGYGVKTVYIWGAVSAPGIWKIEDETTLVELLSVAQPSGLSTATPGSRNEVYIQVYRGAEPNRRKVFETFLGDVLSGEGTFPALQDQDIIVIETRAKQGFLGSQGFTNLISTASTAALLVLSILSISERLGSP